MLSLSDLHLRVGSPSDLQAMHRLDLLCFPEPFRFDLPTMQSFASEPGAIVLLASSSTGELLGFILINLLHRRALRLAYVTTLDVHPDHRRKGIAAFLMRETETRAAHTDAAFLRLHVSTANEDAIRFYERTGFTRHSFVPHFYGEGLHARVYSKILRRSQT